MTGLLSIFPKITGFPGFIATPCIYTLPKSSITLAV